MIWLWEQLLLPRSQKPTKGPGIAQQLCLKAGLRTVKYSQPLRTCFQRLRVEQVHRCYPHCHWLVEIPLRSFPSTPHRLSHIACSTRTSPSLRPARLHHHDRRRRGSRAFAGRLTSPLPGSIDPWGLRLPSSTTCPAVFRAAG